MAIADLVLGTNINNAKARAVARNAKNVKRVRKVPDNININEKRLSHVLNGDKSRRRATGGHSTNSGNVVTKGPVKVDSNGVREATVYIDGVRKTNNGGKSTLFPSRWSDQQILDQVSAGIRRNPLDPNKIVHTVKTPSGITVEIIKRPNQPITTFYPKLGK